MGDSVLNAACEKVAKVAGSTGLGYLEVALRRKKIKVCYRSSLSLLELKHKLIAHFLKYQHICYQLVSITFFKTLSLVGKDLINIQQMVQLLLALIFNYSYQYLYRKSHDISPSVILIFFKKKQTNFEIKQVILTDYNVFVYIPINYVMKSLLKEKYKLNFF